VHPDILERGLSVVFVGTAKSKASFNAGHFYAHPQNMFWPLLEATGLTAGTFIPSSQDRSVLRFGIGLTDLVPSKVASSDSLLRSHDFDVPAFVERIERLRPAVIAFNGAEPARRVARHLDQAAPAEGPTGWTVGGAAAYRLPSSSSANATGGYESKRRRWQAFGEWVRATLGDR
jgi:TDG/mug DNA glycosylase family protein